MSAPCFERPVRVYFEDTDAAGVVYYANYLRYMERARSDWMRTGGWGQDQLLARKIAFVVRAVQIDYLRPARLDDALMITCAVERTGGTQLICTQTVRRQASVLTTATVRLVCVDLERGRACPIPRDILDWLNDTL
jgi:acyl-CoA thioester hydrolase